ncbi:MAG: hypothetical protein QGG48_09945 [Desulfatiglandales bacterium]|jgi:hypothetical protein|nr:hypothetical protein [Desulfatiglandales bacterium]
MPRKNPVIKSKKGLRKIRVAKQMESPEFWDSVFDAISSGISLMEFCQVEDVPYTTVQGKMRRSPELTAKLGRARENRALVHAERMEDIANRVESGELDPKRASVSLQARQWLASRMDSKQWGDLQKVQADIKVTDVNQIYLDQLKGLMAKREPKVINPEDADILRTNEAEEPESEQ